MEMTSDERRAIQRGRRKTPPKWARGLCQQHGCHAKTVGRSPFCPKHARK